MPNTLPPLPPFSSPDAVEGIYRQLGAACLLDACCSSAADRLNHTELYTKLVQHVKDGTFFLFMDSNRNPKGYATWFENQGKKQISKLSTLSRDHSELVAALNTCFPGEIQMAESVLSKGRFEGEGK